MILETPKLIEHVLVVALFVETNRRFRMKCERVCVCVITKGEVAALAAASSFAVATAIICTIV